MHFPSLLRSGLLSVIGCAVFAFAGNAALVDQLDEEQRKQLEDGEAVTVLKNVEGATWPQIKIYKKVDATPSQVADLFTDYENAPTYIPNMIKAEVIGNPDSKSTDVEYTVKVPVLSKISYVVRNHYEKDGDSYKVSWKLLKSAMAKSSTGSLEVEPLNGKTILCYTNLAEPITKLAAALKNQAVGEAQMTVAALSKEAEKRVASSKKP